MATTTILDLLSEDQQALQDLAENVVNYITILKSVRDRYQQQKPMAYSEAEIEHAADAIRDFYLAHYGVKKGNLPDSFYSTPDGELLAYAYKRLHEGDLISFAEGANMIYGCSRDEYSKSGQYRTYMNTLIRPKSGIQARLTLYWDPEDPVYHKRVSRREIEQMLRTASRAR